jgi:hypothetical protein
VRVFPIQTDGFRMVTAVTNATPIVVTTGSVHGLTTGDGVTIEGILSPTNANGNHTITVTSTTAFSIDGSAGNGDYFPPGGQVTYDPTSRSHPAVTSLTGDMISVPEAKETDEFRFYVWADQDPTASTKQLTCKCYGRPSSLSDWFTLATINNSSTWTAGIDDATDYVSKVVDLSVYPELRIDVVAFGSSTTNLKAWIVL